MSIGYIYVLSNPAIKGMVKIGFTRGDVDTRAKELSVGTGVPAPYEVEHFHLTKDVELLERAVHAKLASHRVNDNREFFSISVTEAISVISELVVEPVVRYTCDKKQRTCKRCGHSFLYRGEYLLCPSCGF
ncbi:MULTISPECIES: GIY-YIG nuclease family protein [Marinimicrobium]|uniref:GIY-YIG nuclease family protein n=1 Tax=Marinimicrobium TaxID=359337 RepID=UPI0004633077